MLRYIATFALKQILNLVQLYFAFFYIFCVASRIPFQVVAAIDINPVSNDIYRHNFGSDGHLQKNILSITVAEVENMKADIITLSPPCQPFTR